MTRKLTAVVLSMALIVANLVSCSGRNDSESSESKVTESTTTTATETKKDTSSQATTTETSKGDESSTTTTSSTETTTQSSSEPKNSNRVILDVKNIQQKPELPKGSEITCATMVLNYCGFNVTKMDMLKYLPIAEAPDANGVWVMQDEAYVGNPKSDTGYGCFYSVLGKALENYFKAENNTDYTVEYPDVHDFVELYEEIDKGNPVIVWVTTDMTNSKLSEKGWKTEFLDDYHCVINSHCLVLIGYDKEKSTAIFSDPLNPNNTVEYPSKTVDDVFEQMTKQALVLHKK